jgi:Ca-activated chloride channel homolog
VTTSPPTGTSSRRPLLIASLVGVAAIVATYLLFDRPISAPVTQLCDAPIQLVVSSSTEKDELLDELAGRYNASGRRFEGRCATVKVYPMTSGTAMRMLADGRDPVPDGAPRPQVWLPTSSLWLELLKEEGKGDRVRDESPESITSSVLVVAMPQRMANALDRTNFGWSDILALATAKQGWGSRGRPEWGAFVLGRDNPHFSTSGLAATIATNFAGTRAVTGRSVITEADLQNPDIISFIHNVESSVLRYGDEATKFMQLLYDEDAKRPQIPYVSAVVIQEQLAFLYNRGAPTGDLTKLNSDEPNERLVALHPSDGTLRLDHPFIVLSNASEDEAAAARDFREFLQEPEQQQRFIDAGFRTLDHPERPTALLAQTLDIPADQQLSFITPPSAGLVKKMVTSWDAQRRKARVLLVLDVSGSMGELADKESTDPAISGKTKIDLLKPAVRRGLELLGDDDEVGMWTFSTDYQEVVSISPAREAVSRITQYIDSNQFKAAGNTALYRTTLAAHQKMVTELVPDRINAIVLMTDGKNEDPGHPDDLDPVLNTIGQETSIRIFTIPYGKTDEVVKVDVLAKIAASSKAATYDASNPLDIEETFVSAFSNFGGL